MIHFKVLFNYTMEPDAPKLELKSLIVPAIVFFHKKFINFEDPGVVEKARLALYTVAALSLALYFLLWDLVRRKKDNKTAIWVPPAAQQAIPFMPKPEPPKPEDFEKTTYEAHELKLVRGAVQSLLLSSGIAVFVSYKFNIHVSILMQAIMIPMNLWDSPILKKHFLGVNSGGALYNELFVAPTEASIAKKDTADEDNVPRVEQLPDDEPDTKPKKSSTKTSNNQNISSID